MDLQRKLAALDVLKTNIDTLSEAMQIVDAIDNPPPQEALEQATKSLMESLPMDDIIAFAEEENQPVSAQVSAMITALTDAQTAYLSGNRTALRVSVEHSDSTDINGNDNSTFIIQVALPHTSLLLRTTVTEIRDNCEYRSEPSMAHGAQQFLINGSPMHEKLQEFLPDALKDMASAYISGYKKFLSFHHALAPFYTEQEIADARELVDKNALLLQTLLQNRGLASPT